jgi:SAM-dependent methyltransferase
MGQLAHWDFPPEFTERFPTFIETGCGIGHGLAHAAKYPFRRLISIEIVSDLFARAKDRFGDDRRIEIWGGNSIAVLADVLPRLQGGVFFWLDAHFPGVDFGGLPYSHELDETVQRPLFKELDLIRRSLAPDEYGILIDDMALFDKAGPWEKIISHDFQHLVCPRQGLDFLDPFRETHMLRAYTNDLGYCWILPPDVTPLDWSPAS